MAHKKAGGSTRNGRDSIGKRLGVKRYGGQFVRDRSCSVHSLLSAAIFWTLRSRAGRVE